MTGTSRAAGMGPSRSTGGGAGGSISDAIHPLPGGRYGQLGPRTMRWLPNTWWIPKRRALPYVYTSPPYDAAVGADDLLFCVTNVQQRNAKYSRILAIQRWARRVLPVFRARRDLLLRRMRREAAARAKGLNWAGRESDSE